MRMGVAYKIKFHAQDKGHNLVRGQTVPQIVSQGLLRSELQIRWLPKIGGKHSYLEELTLLKREATKKIVELLPLSFPIYT